MRVNIEENIKNKKNGAIRFDIRMLKQKMEKVTAEDLESTVNNLSKDV